MDKQKELAEIIKECGTYSVELDGYVVNPTTVACKIAGYIKPSVKLELIMSDPCPSCKKFDSKNARCGSEDAFCTLFFRYCGAEKQLLADQQAVSVLVEKAKQDVADEIIDQLELIINKGAPDMGNSPRLFTIQSTKYEALKSKYQRKG